MTRKQQQRAARRARIQRFIRQPQHWPRRPRPAPVYAPPRGDVMVFDTAGFERHVERFGQYVDRLIQEGIRIRT